MDPQSNRRISRDEKSPSPVSRTAEVISFVKTLAIFLVVAYFLRASVVEAFKIPSGSMIPTLRVGDHILVSKLSYGIRLPFMNRFIYQYAMPKRGDIVVFTRPDDPTTPENEAKINIIKRVIGLPGDTVEVRNTRLYINNQLYPESYARWGGGRHQRRKFWSGTCSSGQSLFAGRQP